MIEVHDYNLGVGDVIYMDETCEIGYVVVTVRRADYSINPLPNNPYPHAFGRDTTGFIPFNMTGSTWWKKTEYDIKPKKRIKCLELCKRI